MNKREGVDGDTQHKSCIFHLGRLLRKSPSLNLATYPIEFIFTQKFKLMSYNYFTLYQFSDMEFFSNTTYTYISTIFSSCVSSKSLLSLLSSFKVSFYTHISQFNFQPQLHLCSFPPNRTIKATIKIALPILPQVSFARSNHESCS